MAAAVGDSRVSAGKKLKISLRKKRMKMVVASVASELEDKDKDASDNEGSLGSCGLEKDHFSSGDEAVEADNEDEAEPREDDNDSAAEATAGANAGWADAMARILSKKIPESKPTILVRNKELEKEKEKLKQERLEKRKQTEAKSEEGPGWTILRDDFMTGASMKDWDKESDGPDGSRLGCGSDSDT